MPTASPPRPTSHSSSPPRGPAASRSSCSSTGGDRRGRGGLGARAGGDAARPRGSAACRSRTSAGCSCCSAASSSVRRWRSTRASPRPTLRPSAAWRSRRSCRRCSCGCSTPASTSRVPRDPGRRRPPAPRRPRARPGGRRPRRRDLRPHRVLRRRDLRGHAAPRCRGAGRRRGRIELSGRMLMLGYRFDAQATAGPSPPTGGCGPETPARSARTAGSTSIGRVDDLINSGGEKVWPQEVEAALRTHPKVSEVLVRGREPTPNGGIASSPGSSPPIPRTRRPSMSSAGACGAPDPPSQGAPRGRPDGRVALGLGPASHGRSGSPTDRE